MSINSNKYRPTAAEKKILQVLCNPEHTTKSVTDICEIAGVNRSTYYRAFAKPAFVEYYHDACRQMLAECVGPVIRACEKKAREGSFPHAKLLLEMAGMYAQRHDLDIEQTVQVVFKIPRPSGEKGEIEIHDAKNDS